LFCKLNLFSELANFFGEADLDVLKFILDILKFFVELGLLVLLEIKCGSEFFHFVVELFFHLGNGVVFSFDESFFFLDLLSLNSNLVVELLAFCLLFLLEVSHVFLQLLSVLFNIINFLLLGVQQRLSLIKFLVLVPQSVYLSFEFVWFLFFDHFHVTLGNLLNFLKARMTESVSLESDFCQTGVFVKGLQENRFDVLTEEVIGQLN
jgi:hypothetical protein